MGVDYTGIGGVGIKISEEILEGLFKNKVLLRSDWELEGIDCLDIIGLPYREAGSYGHGGNRRLYFLVEGDTLEEINKNSPKFIKKLKKIKINIKQSDLKVISDLHIW